MSVRSVATCAASLAVIAGAACAPPRAPTTPGTAVLVRDLQRLVDVRAARGWQIDRTEVTGLLPDALESVCRTPPPLRLEAVAWLDAEVARLGGPVDVAYRARGRRLGAVKELLAWTRVRDLAARAVRDAPADCPFWAEPSPTFAGRQIADDRWQLHIEGGGKGILLATGGTIDAAGGGGGRFMFGRTFGARWELLAGVELGGSAALPKDDLGNRGGPEFAIDTVVPVAVRYREVNTYVEASGGLLLHTKESERGDAVPGWHVGLAFGARAVRTRWLIPGLAFATSLERTVPDAGEPPLTMIKVGLRVTIDVDL